jgi:hypothetical protein
VLIIAILATLVTLGVSKAMSYAKQVATKTEMGQIEHALGVAAIEMGRVPFIPSYLVLLPTPASYDSYAGPDKAFADMSRRILTQMFPKWAAGVKPASWGSAKLGADQAFVFLLRGKDGNGFSASDGDPCAPGGKRFGPYYEFKADRLNMAPNGFPQYRDYWDNPGKHLVVYSQMMVGQSASPAGEVPAGSPGRQFQAANKYFMPKGYQILSAGKDGKWGAYTTPVFTGNLVGDGEDDQSNFADEPHGKPVAD